MIAAWIVLGLIVAFLALRAWDDAGEAIAEGHAADEDGPHVADRPVTRVLMIALTVVGGLAVLGVEIVIDSHTAGGDDAPCIAIERPAPSALRDHDAAEAYAALLRGLGPDLCR